MPPSVSKSHQEDNSPKTRAAGAPIQMMTATKCHHTAEKKEGTMSYVLISGGPGIFFGGFFFCLFLWLFSVSTCEFDLKKKNTYIYFKMRNEVRKTTNFVKKKCNFQSVAVGWYKLEVRASIVELPFAFDGFIET